MIKREVNKKTAELSITVAAKKTEWKEMQDKALDGLIKNLSVKGFRKGHVPANIAKKHIPAEDILAKALKKALDKLVVVAAKEIKKALVLESPTYKVEKVSDAELEVTFIYPIYPEVKLPDYKKMGVKYVEPKIGKSLIDDELKRLQEQNALMKPKTGAIVKGDIAIFDFLGFVDGKKFEGGKAKDYELEIGSGAFIPGFEDQMIGLKKGDKKDIKVSFPKEYQAPVLAGKEATFQIKVNEIKVKELPKLDDKFVKELGIKKAQNIAELKKYLMDIFKGQKEQEARGQFQREIFLKIKAKADIPLPLSLISKEMQQLFKQFEEDIKKQKMTIDQYKKMTGMDDAKLELQFKEQAESRLKDSFIFAEISKHEKITIANKDYDAEYIKLAKVYNQPIDSIKGMITKEQMQIPMTNDKVLDLLIKANGTGTATTKKAPVKKAPAKTQTTKKKTTK